MTMDMNWDHRLRAWNMRLDWPCTDLKRKLTVSLFRGRHAGSVPFPVRLSLCQPHSASTRRKGGPRPTPSTSAPSSQTFQRDWISMYEPSAFGAQQSHRRLGCWIILKMACQLQWDMLKAGNAAGMSRFTLERGQNAAGGGRMRSNGEWIVERG